MNCATHPEQIATAYCRSCGKPLCDACRCLANGTIYCSEHAPASVATVSAASPYTSPAPVAEPGASPALAFLLGLIPGVGAIYNGQYVKGLVHVVILGVLISVVSSGEAGGLEPLFGMLIAAWVFYMAFEAYHTAKKRRVGQPVDEFSSLVPVRAGPRRDYGGFPVRPVVLIAVGVLFLLHNLGILRLSQLARYWPIALIALGVYMLYERLSSADRRSEASAANVQEVTHERE